MSLAASSSAVVVGSEKLASSVTSRRTTSGAGPELTIVVPTLNEHDNVGPLIDRLDRLLEGVGWEAVFVDDDSADDMAAHLRDLGRTDRRIRCIRRFGRRGPELRLHRRHPVDFCALHRGYRRRSTARRSFAARACSRS
jgi:cellulose synthase/poly-beta-1,6-N-acetylglucosamine synthase-like glycosyltransferase